VPTSPNTDTNAPIVVIGGGISGLACAHRLQKDGFAVLLLESSPRFGGVLDTVEKEGFLFDIGPQSFLATEPLMTLIEDLGLGGELLRADPRAPRYILLSGRLVPAPLGPASLIRTPLISWRTKLRLVSEPLGRTHPPEGDESIANFVRRKFGEDLLTNLAGPFISGVYAGDPEKLSLESAFPIARRLEQRYGSLIRGAIKMRRQGGGGPRPPLCNFRKGTVTLVSALTAALADSAQPGAPVASIAQRAQAPGEPASFDVTYQDGTATQSLAASAIVLATPAQQAAGLLRGIAPSFPDLLSQIEYAPVAQVAAGYRLSQISRFSAATSAGPSASSARGFGFLVPRTEGLRLLGTVWNSFLFPGRAPEISEKMVSFTSFVGGATDPEITRQPEDAIAALVHKELSAVLAITGLPVAQHVARWERALPQYNLGHPQIIASLAELCAHSPGLFLTGNYLSGPSLGSCVEHAHNTAAAVAHFLRAQT